MSVVRCCLDDTRIRARARTHTHTQVVTTGGTGPALRDVTPEAMAAVCDKVTV